MQVRAEKAGDFGWDVAPVEAAENQYRGGLSCYAEYSVAA